MCLIFRREWVFYGFIAPHLRQSVLHHGFSTPHRRQNQCLRIATSLEEWYKLGNKRDDRFLGVVSKFYRDYPATNDRIDTPSGN